MRQLLQAKKIEAATELRRVAAEKQRLAKEIRDAKLKARQDAIEAPLIVDGWVASVECVPFEHAVRRKTDLRGRSFDNKWKFHALVNSIEPVNDNPSMFPAAPAAREIN